MIGGYPKITSLIISWAKGLTWSWKAMNTTPVFSTSVPNFYIIIPTRPFSPPWSSIMPISTGIWTRSSGPLNPSWSRSLRTAGSWPGGMRPWCGRSAGAQGAPVAFYGQGPHCHWRIADLSPQAGGMNFTVLREGKAWGEFFLPMLGTHNVWNGLAALAALAEVSCKEASPATYEKPWRAFRGCTSARKWWGNFREC